MLRVNDGWRSVTVAEISQLNYRHNSEKLTLAPSGNRDKLLIHYHYGLLDQHQNTVRCHLPAISHTNGQLLSCTRF